QRAQHADCRRADASAGLGAPGDERAGDGAREQPQQDPAENAHRGLAGLQLEEGALRAEVRDLGVADARALAPAVVDVSAHGEAWAVLRDRARDRLAAQALAAGLIA